MSRLPATRALLLSALIGLSPAHATDDPPTAPAGLLARAYGPTSGGVRWERSSDDRGVVGYEIARDGIVLGVRDTLSHVEDALEPGRSYRYAVTAIDTAGQRSDSSRVELSTAITVPAPPAGLRVAIYSSTAAGLAWSRPALFGLRYEVRRDGIVVATTDAISHIDTRLSPNREYRFEVIAINRQGGRSNASSLTFRTPRGAPGTAAPTAPTGLRAAVYSSTAAGIAWQRPASPGLRYEVRRDGEPLIISDAISYVDQALAAGQSYRYEVIAIDASGRRSEASRISLGTYPGTPGPGPTPPPDEPLPTPDCMGDTGADGTTVCIDPASRVVTATRPDGTLAWSITLAEGELAGPIAALAVAAGTPWLVAVADIGPPCRSDDASPCARSVTLTPVEPAADDRVRQELVLGSAGFVGTDGSAERLYQLDGTPLLAVGVGDALYLAVDVHELIPGADPELFDSWRLLGTSVVRVSATPAEPGLKRPLAARLYPDRRVRRLSRTRDGGLHVELDAGAERLDPISLLPSSPAPGRALFADRAYEAVAPALVSRLRDAAIASRTDRLTALGELARASASSTTIMESDVPDPPPGPGEDQDSRERFAHDCAAGGTLEFERRLWRVYPEQELDESYRFTGCRVAVPVDDATLPDGVYRLDGEFTIERDSRFGSFYIQNTRHAWRTLTLEMPDGLASRTDGQTMAQYTSTHAGETTTRVTDLALYEQHRGETPVVRIRDVELDERSQNTLGRPSTRFGGGWSIRSAETGGQQVTVLIDPAFETSLELPVPPESAPTRRFTGQLRATADDASTLEVSAATDRTGDELIADFSVSDAQASLSERKRYQALSLPISVYAGEVD